MNEMLEIAIREIEKVADTKIEQISINVSDYDDETKTLSIDISYHKDKSLENLGNIRFKNMLLDN